MNRRFLRPPETWLTVSEPRVSSPMANIIAPKSSDFDGYFVVFTRLKRLAGKGLDGVFRLLARFVKRMQIRADGSNALPRDVLR